MVLGLQLGSVAGGFAARGSQVFEQEREEVSRLMDIKLKDSLTRGQARWAAHKAEKKAKAAQKVAQDQFNKSVGD